MDDYELLREYAGSQSQEAFRELVDRHLPMVYSTARRVVGDPHLAEEVAQEAFITLAQKAANLTVSQVVGGWLYHTTRNLALHAIRSEQRRRERERIAQSMQADNDQNDAGRIAQNLEPAMAELEPPERDALVLRYLEERSLREVGRELGISEDAARMRVNRALERLRIVFAKHGISATSAVIVTALGASTSSAVPGGLAMSISAAALAAKASAAGPTLAATAKTVAGSWLNTKTIAAVLGSVILAGTATHFVQQRQVRLLNAQNAALAAQQRELTEQIEAQSKEEQVREQERQQFQQQSAELSRLRNEMTQLRRQEGSNRLKPSAGEITWSLDPKVLAQNPPVVLIRPSEEQGVAGMISSPEGTIAFGTYLSNIVAYAYSFLANRIVMPPDTPQGKFDFLVTLPQGGREALQKLLKQQFGLAAKREIRQLESLQLTLNAAHPLGPKPSTKSPGAGGESHSQTNSQIAGPPDRLEGEGMPMSALAGQIETMLGLPVVDATGLTGRYDYQLAVKPGASLEEVKHALADQLGLDLSPEEQKETAEFLIVERQQ